MWLFAHCSSILIKTKRKVLQKRKESYLNRNRYRNIRFTKKKGKNWERLKKDIFCCCKPEGNEPFSISTMNRTGNIYRFLQEKFGMLGMGMNSVSAKPEESCCGVDCLCKLWNGSDRDLKNRNLPGLMVGPSSAVDDYLKYLPGVCSKHSFSIFMIL